MNLTTRNQGRKTELVLLVVVLALGVALRVFLLEGRWINPDEGAHLMDGVYFLEGQVPGIDFRARQLLYTQLTGLAVWVFGQDLFQLRLFPITVIALSGLLIHAIARELWDWKTGLVATALFLLLPFSVVMTVHTKTEPLAILTAAGAVYGLVRARSRPSRRGVLLFVSGICLGLAFYVRESTLALVAAALSVTLVEEWGAWARLARSWAAVLLGLGTVTLGAFAYYGFHGVAPESLFATVSNPFSFLATNVRSFLDTWQGSGAASAGSPSRGDRLPLGMSLGYVVEVARVSVVLLVGAALPLLAAGYRSVRQGASRGERAILVPAAWLAWLAAAYVFWTLKRGFFPAYFLEFVAPLSLLAAAVLVRSLRGLGGESARRVHLVTLVLLVLLMGGVHIAAGTWQISRPLYFLLTVPILALIYLPPRPARPERGSRGRWAAALGGMGGIAVLLVLVGPRLPWAGSIPLYAAGGGAVLALGLWAPATSAGGGATVRRSFVACALLVSALFLTLSESGVLLDSRYDALWSPDTLERTADFLERNVPEDASVVSGGVIWALQSGRRPFANITHPLGLMAGVTDQQKRRVERGLAGDPPDAIILDGFTERTYMRAFPALSRALETGYRHAVTFGGDIKEVRIYLPDRRRDDPGS